MDHVTIIGLLAGLCTTVSFVPQMLKIYRTKRTSDLALNTYLLLACGLFLWIIYGLFLKQIAIILTNAVVFIMCNYIIYMIKKHG